VKLSSRPRPTEATFDLTPMIDVVMLLIVFFTLTSQFKDAMPTKVELPSEVGQEMSESAASTISLELSRDGILTSHGKTVRLDEVLAELPGGASANSAERAELVLRADRLCSIGDVNKVTKAIAAAGVRRLKIITAGSGTPATNGGATP
jgi:biopolymer transport protein ExbD